MAAKKRVAGGMTNHNAEKKEWGFYTIRKSFTLLSLLFFLTKKVTKKSRQTLLLRSFAGPAHLLRDE
jgi:hypothetical protein